MAATHFIVEANLNNILIRSSRAYINMATNGEQCRGNTTTNRTRGDNKQHSTRVHGCWGECEQARLKLQLMITIMLIDLYERDRRLYGYDFAIE